MIKGSKIESLPEFPKDSRLQDITDMCRNCTSLSDIPSLPDSVTECSSAFTNTSWDDNKPIFDKSDGANIVPNDMFNF